MRMSGRDVLDPKKKGRLSAVNTQPADSQASGELAMSRIICTATPKIKPTRKIQRPATRFGKGILRYVPSVGPGALQRGRSRLAAQNPTTAEGRH